MKAGFFKDLLLELLNSSNCSAEDQQKDGKGVTFSLVKDKLDPGKNITNFAQKCSLCPLAKHQTHQRTCVEHTFSQNDQ
jgi:hypothetical protein